MMQRNTNQARGSSAIAANRASPVRSAPLPSCSTQDIVSPLEVGPLAERLAARHLTKND